MKVIWKKVILHGVDGNRFVGHPLGFFHERFPHALDEIRQMPPGIPISFERAVQIFNDDINACIGVNDLRPGDIAQIGLAKWMASLGYQIILSGHEFDVIS
jgi:hypothetical protein